MPCFLSLLWTWSPILGRHALCWAGSRCTVHLEWWRGSWVSFLLEPCFALAAKCYAFGFPWRTHPSHLGSGFALWTSPPGISHYIYLHLSWHGLFWHYHLPPLLVAHRIFLWTPSYQDSPCSFQPGLINPGQHWTLLLCRRTSTLMLPPSYSHSDRALSYFYTDYVSNCCLPNCCYTALKTNPAHKDSMRAIFSALSS